MKLVLVITIILLVVTCEAEGFEGNHYKQILESAGPRLQKRFFWGIFDRLFGLDRNGQADNTNAYVLVNPNNQLFEGGFGTSGERWNGGSDGSSWNGGSDGSSGKGKGSHSGVGNGGSVGNGGKVRAEDKRNNGQVNNSSTGARK